jgi:putative effector of murein hydrolase
MNNVSQAALAIGATLLFYFPNLKLYQRYRRLWLSPLILTPACLIAVMSFQGFSSASYMVGSRPLLWMIGPLTLAFAVPVFQHRDYVKTWWPALLAGTCVASLSTIVSALLLSRWFGLPDSIAHSLVARSISLPFAFVVSNELSGQHDLTAVFVVVSGIVGIIAGDIILAVMKFKTDHSHGAALGAVAQVVGVARAHEHNATRGVMASLTMIFSGAFTVVIAPIVVRIITRS